MNRLLSVAVHAWPKLKTLALGDYQTTDHLDGDNERGPDPLVAFLQTHLDLERLYFRKCQFTDRTLDAMAALHLPYLTELTITDTNTFPPRTLRQLVLGCPELALIVFWGCKFPSSTFPEAGVSCRDMPQCHPSRDCHYLHHLDREDIHQIRLNGLAGENDNTPTATTVESLDFNMF
jgi:hypothetical protein